MFKRTSNKKYLLIKALIKALINVEKHKNNIFRCLMALSNQLLCIGKLKSFSLHGYLQ